MTRPGIEPRFPGPLANTLTAGPISKQLRFQLIILYINTLQLYMYLLSLPHGKDLTQNLNFPSLRLVA